MTFTVTITDTTAPVIDQLDNIVEEANTLGGRVVTFTATASDIVDGPLTPTCVPASGFLFPVGTTTVSCDVSDNEGNAAYDDDIYSNHYRHNCSCYRPTR